MLKFKIINLYGAVQICTVTTISLLYMHHRDKLAPLHSVANRAPVTSKSNTRQLEGLSGSPTAVPNPNMHVLYRPTPPGCEADSSAHTCSAQRLFLQHPAAAHPHLCLGSWESLPDSEAAQQPWSYPSPYSNTRLCIPQSRHAHGIC